ncbi:MAG: SNF2 helicase associated domain-containing protein [Sedimentibacter sp.]
MGKINFNIEDIKNYADTLITYRKGLAYYKDNKVSKLSIEKIYNEETVGFENKYSAKVKGHSYPSYNTSVTVDNDGEIVSFNCSCPAFDENPGGCKHIVAVMLKIYNSYNLNVVSYDDVVFKNNLNQASTHNFPLEDLISTFENKIKKSVIVERKDGSVILKPILYISGRDTIAIEFTIGSKKNYVVKDAYALANNIKHTNNVCYGKSLEFNHEISGFEKSSQPLAVFLRDEADAYMQVIARTSSIYNNTATSGRAFKIFPFSLDSFFDLFSNQTVVCNGYKYQFKTLTFIDKSPEVEFYINEENEQYYLSTNLFITFVENSINYTYIIAEDKLYRCSREFVDTILPAVNKITMQPSKTITFTKEHIGKFYSTVLPEISKYATVKSNVKLSNELNALPLSSSIYLDCNNHGFIYASVIFNYGDIEINPFRKSAKDNTIIRNISEETKVLIALENCGFEKTTAKYSMTDEDNIYEFLTTGVNTLTSLCEVNVSDDFKKINIRYPKSMSMGVKLNSNLIELDIEKLEFDPSELKDILLNYKRKKKYFRLKDGSFLNLEKEYFSTMEKLVEDLNISGEQLKTGHIEISKYRSFYLDSLLKNNSWIKAEKSQPFKEMVYNINESGDSDFVLPKELKPIMRNYQVTGYKWLRSLSTYSFGGILADDMGLGKTLQAISLLLSEKKSGHKTSIVICPTSLVYNWQSEIEKFSPEITTLIIAGNAIQRSELIACINDYDLIFTSYDLIKRDIELYENLEFKYCILDEAQYIKNSTTQNAKAVKLIKSDVRFALTGTPIENSLADLWSIFDFIMPGFLLSYKKFKDKYEIPIVKEQNSEILQRLHKQIQPFILRRLKKDVLKELPDKIETLYYAQMETVQKKLYFAELMKLNEQFNNEIESNGYNKSQIKILSMLTRLRQICCDPSLYFDNYKGGSAKLDLCMEIVKESIENGHKILIFSQFTSMLSIIEKHLSCNFIDYYLLTGSTKSMDRLDMANNFNNDKTPVFLISLKAGGTGLNLTGADVVIHYDPWWNISAQNQATDRTHRIGQTNKVQVFKLIAKDTIEEKIEKLQQSKSSLADSVIKKGEILINSLSKEEIKSLFQL